MTTRLAEGSPGLLAYLKEETGRSPAALQRALATMPDPAWQAKLLAACSGDEELYRRILPIAGLIRVDDLDRPVVILPGSVYVTAGADRRSTGAHYTQRILTEPIVQHTLEPLVYVGPAEGLPKEQWKLRPAAVLIKLKLCDMAMGSGAFLVQVCRYLADRLLEALEREGFFSRQEVKAHRGKKGSEELDVFASLRETLDPEERTILARRLVAERCLYGVDKNPLAVEMAKLSLWLITMDKGRAFSFLGHALKCGDSLVGIHSLDQLRTWSLEGSGERLFGTLELDLIIKRMIEARLAIEALPVRDIEDQQVKGYLLADAEAITHDLKVSADMLIASYYNMLKKQEQATLRQALLLVSRDGADIEAKWRQYADLRGMQPFHWPLEFPEVFLGVGRTGFDGFVGNPPFIGGLRIRGALGEKYLYYLKTRWPHAPGVGDYCAYFFLRAYEQVRIGGATGLIATNTIAQGDTRELGLDHICANGGTIYHAENNYRWPGQAAVVVNIVHLYKGDYAGHRILDGRTVKHISPLLDDTKTTGNPYRLVANVGKSFIGSLVLGMGFTMSPEEADKMIADNPRNADVLFPYLNGEDLNSHPEQQPSRWVINFYDWPLERSAVGSWALADDEQRTAYLRTGRVPKDYPDPVATDYPEYLAIVRDKVKPERDIVKYSKTARGKWWIYERARPELYALIAPLRRVLVASRVTKYVTPIFVSQGWVYSEQTVVFSSERAEMFLMLQSTLHERWAWQYSSTLGNNTLRYAPSDILERLPLPPSEQLEENHKLAESYHEHRRQTMIDRQEGLTATYNRVHDPGEAAAGIARLRQLHMEMDHAVAAAYGWGDLDLGHGFHETAQGIRYTISEPARRQVLGRLLKLNPARYAEEVAMGLHTKKEKPKDEGETAKGKNVAGDRLLLL